jgi:hypothetical protein
MSLSTLLFETDLENKEYSNSQTKFGELKNNISKKRATKANY